MSRISRILFVDDEHKVLDALKRQLRPRRTAWDMTFIDCPKAALRQCRKAAPDLVVLDLQMPGMTGIELAKAIHEALPQTVCIMLTGAGTLQVAMEAVNDAGIFRFYTKPCDIEVLAGGIEDGLAMAARRAESAATTEPDAIGSAVGRVALERLPIGVIVLDGQGKVVFTNAAGGGFLAERDGISLSADGTCRASTPAETKALRDCVRSVLENREGGDGGIALSRSSMHRPLSAIATPIDDPDGAGIARVALFITDPERQARPSRTMLQKLFRLTGSEAKIVQGLAEGKSLEEIAPEAGITLNSARTYLKQVFAKTGTNRQADLVRMVLTSPAVMHATAKNSNTESVL
jgi:DNA-binding NarL/FixJ family response regulator